MRACYLLAILQGEKSVLDLAVIKVSAKQQVKVHHKAPFLDHVVLILASKLKSKCDVYKRK